MTADNKADDYMTNRAQEEFEKRIKLARQNRKLTDEIHNLKELIDDKDVQIKFLKEKFLSGLGTTIDLNARLDDAMNEIQRMHLTKDWLIEEVNRLRTENEQLRDRIADARAVLFIK